MHRCDLDGERGVKPVRATGYKLDDGEAACLAIAKVRGWILATDDRKCRREAAGLGVPVITTPELLKSWAEATRAEEAAVAKLLRDIRSYASFAPHKTMPLHDWWVEMISKSES